MKIYISADIEGISGVVNNTHTSQDGYDYNRARRLMTNEVNAVVKGLKATGGREILVNDSHGPMTNIIIEELDEDVKLISGNKKLLGMMEGIDKTYDAAIFIGYHARHNTSGVLSHSYHGAVVSEVKLNGNAIGEFEFNSLVAGYFDIPVVLVSGDDILSKQVKTFNEDIESVIVKRAHSRYTAECIHPKKVYKILEEKISETISKKLDIIKPCKIEGKVELEVAFMNNGMAESTLFIPGVEIVSPNRVKYTAKDIIEAYKVRIALTILAASTLK
ncbi:M55 family metallopeptidase [Tepidibacter aestuarii]|uniref:M55 family metallopeptidase n=1 Tax=Tepidibacter aestuarii TaxID=2925782 RepID=UPI0020BE3F44|nr:M55 family metallopeptidase [Tepidibacter aestuarii]CAH2212724.1 Peptidase M55 D-aminopeptidase [Tepidibacter aestuarii]